ncbi:MAG: TIGR00269 family protein [Candidatus Thorarchaeota archaeon]
MCKDCLIQTTEERVRRTINAGKMLHEDDRIVVAISGGKDSAVLLDLLSRIEKNHPRAKLIPLCIDEGIEGYRSRSIAAAQSVSDRVGLELHVAEFAELFGVTLDEIVQLRKAGDVGACSYCGVLRRRAINHMARRLDATVVATGHTLDDEAQTVIMNLMRGDGRRIATRSLERSRLDPSFVPRVKPISRLTERDVVAYAHHTGLPYHSSPCPYASEAFRNDVRLFLNAMEYRRPGTLSAIVNSAQYLSEALHGLSTDRDLSRCVRCGEVSPNTLCKACELLDRLRSERRL